MKRALCLALVLLLMPAALAEVWAVDMANPDSYSSFSMLVRDDGTVLVPPGEYPQLLTLTPEFTPESDCRFAAARSGPIEYISEYEVLTLYALMDGEGRLLTDYLYTYLYWDEPSGLVYFEKPDRERGFMNPNGEERISDTYEDLVPCADGGFLCLRMLSDGEHCALERVNPDGTGYATGLRGTGLTGADRPGDPVQLSGVQGYDGYSLYINDAGEALFGASYDEASSFENGLAVVVPAKDKHMGVIDIHGNYVLEPTYREIHRDTSNGLDLLIAWDGETYALLDADTLQPRGAMDLSDYPQTVHSYPNVLSGCCINLYLYDEEYNSIGSLRFDINGNPVLRDLPDDVDLYGFFGPTDAPVNRLSLNRGVYPDNTETLLTPDGKPCSPPFHSINLGVCRNGVCRFLITGDNFRVISGEDIRYEDERSLRYGVCDADGKVLLEPVYPSIQVLDLDRYWVNDGQRTGLIDGEGHWYCSFSNYMFLMD